MAAIRLLGRTAFVALFICTLVVVAFAQDPSAQTPTVVVKDQAPINGNVTIEQVMVPQQAFLVIQRDLAGAAGSILGRVALQTGTTENVVVPLETAVAPGDQLYAVLYSDAAPVGVFDAPGADTPLLVNNQPVAQPFAITADNPPAQATASPTQTESVTPTTQPLVQPTTTVTVTTPITLNLTATPNGQLPLSATLTATPSPTTLVITQPTAQATTQPVTQPITQPITQPVAQTGTSPLVQPVAQPTSPLPTPIITTPTAAPTLPPTLEPTVTPTSQPATPVSTATPTQTPTEQSFLQPQTQPTPPTPAAMPVTGASSAAHLPVTLWLSALAFVLFVGGDSLRQRLSKRKG